MIFITTGTQEPFDRLVKAVDEIAEAFDPADFVVQVADSGYRVKNMTCVGFLTPKEFDAFFSKAQLVVSHAGMGTIISALTKSKPILVMPRLAELREHRNDHQLATAREMEKLQYVHTAYNEKDLQRKLLTLLNSDLSPLHQIGRFASESLINAIKGEVAVSKARKLFSRSEAKQF